LEASTLEKSYSMSVLKGTMSRDFRLQVDTSGAP
jgi:hypothetical protein